MESWLVWLILVIFLAFIEVITINLVTIWFVLSGIISLIVSIYVDDITLQFGIFVIGGVLFLIFTRPLLSRLLVTNKVSTNLDRIIGMTGIVIEKISSNECGAVRVDGKVWTAYSDCDIDIHEKVKIVGIKGAKVIVKREEK